MLICKTEHELIIRKTNLHVVPIGYIRIAFLMIKEHSIFHKLLSVIPAPFLSVVNDKPDLIFKCLFHVRVKLCCMLVLALVQNVFKKQGRDHTYTTFSAWKRET